MCLSVPGLPAIWARGLAENVARHETRFGRKVEHVRLGPGDNWFCCQCEKCIAPLTLPDGSQLECEDPDSIKDPLFRSTQIMMFINEAMPTWQALRPETPIHVLAYIHFAEPPRVPVHPDLGIWFAPYPTSNMHFPLLDPRQPEPWRSRFAKWLTMNDRLGFYEYFEAKPSPQAFYAAANLRAVMQRPDHRNALIYAEISNDRGTDGIGNGEFGWDVGLMNHWVHTRLFWDPTQDVDELYRYYIERTYREAAPADACLLRVDQEQLAGPEEHDRQFLPCQHRRCVRGTDRETGSGKGMHAAVERGRGGCEASSFTHDDPADACPIRRLLPKPGTAGDCERAGDRYRPRRFRFTAMGEAVAMRRFQSHHANRRHSRCAGNHGREGRARRRTSVLEVHCLGQYRWHRAGDGPGRRPRAMAPRRSHRVLALQRTRQPRVRLQRRRRSVRRQEFEPSLGLRMGPAYAQDATRLGGRGGDSPCRRSGSRPARPPTGDGSAHGRSVAREAQRTECRIRVILSIIATFRSSSNRTTLDRSP